LGYLATSGAKYDIMFLLSDPDFLLRWRNFASISLSYQIPILGYFGVFGFFWVFSHVRCKIWRHIRALRRPTQISYESDEIDEILRVSRVVFEIW